MKVRLKKLQNDIPETDDNENLNEELYGSDGVSVELKEAEKFEFGFSFSAQDGELGNETEDFGDLPHELKKAGHIYDPALPAGSRSRKTDPNEITDTMRIATEDEIGLSYGEDNYVDDDHSDERKPD